MPETSGNATIYLYLTERDLVRLHLLNELGFKGDTIQLSCCTATKTAEGVTLETEQEVTLEFDLSDYAPDRDEP